MKIQQPIQIVFGWTVGLATFGIEFVYADGTTIFKGSRSGRDPLKLDVVGKIKEIRMSEEEKDTKTAYHTLEVRNEKNCCLINKADNDRMNVQRVRYYENPGLPILPE